MAFIFLFLISVFVNMNLNVVTTIVLIYFVNTYVLLVKIWLYEMYVCLYVCNYTVMWIIAKKKYRYNTFYNK